MRKGLAVYREFLLCFSRPGGYDYAPSYVGIKMHFQRFIRTHYHSTPVACKVLLQSLPQVRQELRMYQQASSQDLYTTDAPSSNQEEGISSPCRTPRSRRITRITTILLYTPYYLNLTPLSAHTLMLTHQNPSSFPSPSKETHRLPPPTSCPQQKKNINSIIPSRH